MTEHGTIRVRGRDFVGYRIGGTIAAIIFGLALVWQAIHLFQGFNIVVPEVTWEAADTSTTSSPLPGAAEAPGSRSLASEILRQRTTMMDDRQRSGPAPGQPAPGYAVGPEEYLQSRTVDVADSNIPRAWSIPNETSLSIMRKPEELIGFTAVPYSGAGIFERPDGRIWRRGMADYVVHLGAIAILGTCFLVAAVLAIRGRVPIVEGPDGRSVIRFGFVERAVHWMTAGSFVVLTLSGLVLAFGTSTVGPWLGEQTLSNLGWVSIWGHMIFAPPFFLGIVAMTVMWLLRNLPEPRLDLPWLARLGGFMSDSADNPPARKFNAGQKLTFWVAVLGGLAMTVTGVLLMFPYSVLDLQGLLWTMLAHAVIGVLLIAFFIGHAYIGTVGMQDAIGAMWSGRVDLNWAREHHDLWLDELARQRKIPPEYISPRPPQVEPERHRPGARAVAAGRRREA